MAPTPASEPDWNLKTTLASTFICCPPNRDSTCASRRSLTGPSFGLWGARRRRRPAARAYWEGSAGPDWSPYGHGRLQLTKFHAPSGRGGDRHAPANTPGIRHVALAVDDIDVVVASLRARGAKLVGEVERYEDSYRLCYVRGPEGIIVELAEEIG